MLFFKAKGSKPAPEGIDGISVLPELLKNKTAPHPPLYWEFHEKGLFRAVRLGDWKGIRRDPVRPPTKRRSSGRSKKA
jgi:hypothetical protein